MPESIGWLVTLNNQIMIKTTLFFISMVLSVSVYANAISESFVHTATVDNISSDITYIDHPGLNNNPDAMPLVTQNFNPSGSEGVNNNYNYGVYYSVPQGKWGIYNESWENMPVGASFNVLLPGDDVEAFEHNADSSNISGHMTKLDHPLLNDHPDALFQITQYWKTVYNDHPIGIWYNDIDNRWYVFNQDFATMPENTSYFIMIITRKTDTAKFIFEANTTNITENFALVDNPLTNGNHDAIVLYTQNLNPGETDAVYNDHNTGAWYNTIQWGVFNQDYVSMTENATFNMYVPPGNVLSFVHSATIDNTESYVTFIDHPMINKDSNAIILVTQCWNPEGSTGVYNSHTFGVGYDLNVKKWVVYNEDFEYMPEGASFIISVIRNDQSSFAHKATIENTTGNSTFIDHPGLNGNQDAIFFVSQNWNPDTSVTSGVYNDHPIGVWYTGSKWAVFNQDEEAIPEGASFNVLIPDDSLYSFVQTANSENTDGYRTIIDHPKLNNDPDAIILVTQNSNPEGGEGIYNAHPIGTSYNGSRWTIFNQDLEEMPEGASFNVGILQGNGTPDSPEIPEEPDTTLSANKVTYNGNTEVLNVFPNPCTESTTIYVNLNEGNKVILKLVDRTGKTMQIVEKAYLTEGLHAFNLDLTELSAGIYLGVLETGSAKYIRQLIIIK